MGRARCVRCGEQATTIVIELSMLVAYLDLCQLHLGYLLRNARPVASTRSVDDRPSAR